MVFQVLLIMELDKKYKGFRVPNLLKPFYTNQDYMEKDDPLKT